MNLRVNNRAMSTSAHYWEDDEGDSVSNAQLQKVPSSEIYH